MIETERLLLRRLTEADAQALFEAESDPEVMQYIGDGATAADLDESRRRLATRIERWDADGFGAFAIERREDGRVLGRTGFLVWDSESWRAGTLAELGERGVVELGWLLAREHWGSGYATEAAAASRDYGFVELGFARLISLILRGNERSVRVAHRIGARYVRDVSRDDWTAQLFAVEPRR